MKLIQICASQNDLFGLDGDGHVYQYNFNTNGWMRIGLGRSAASMSTESSAQNLDPQHAGVASSGVR
jgi:hypothetical protein